MMTDNILSGSMVSGHRHIFPLRIYYADTDFSGVVYHARYLEFLERARTEFLRHFSISHSELRESVSGESFAFAVRRMEIDFLFPSRIDDLLSIETILSSVRGALLVVEQKIFLEEVLLVRAKVDIVYINAQGRPRRLPKEWVEKFHFAREGL